MKLMSSFISNKLFGSFYVLQAMVLNWMNVGVILKMYHRMKGNPKPMSSGYILQSSEHLFTNSLHSERLKLLNYFFVAITLPYFGSET